MKNPTLVKRYTAGLAGALPDEAEYEAVCREIWPSFPVCYRLDDSPPALLPVLHLLVQKGRDRRGDPRREKYGAKTSRFPSAPPPARPARDPAPRRPGPARGLDAARGMPTFEVRSVVPVRGPRRPGWRRSSSAWRGARVLRLRPRPGACRRACRAEGQPRLRRLAQGQLLRLKDMIGERVPWPSKPTRSARSSRARSRASTTASTSARSGRSSRSATASPGSTGSTGSCTTSSWSFPTSVAGIALNLEEDSVGVVLLGESHIIKEGDVVKRTHRIISVPAGPALVGRVVDPLGKPLDGKGPIKTDVFLPVERLAPRASSTACPSASRCRPGSRPSTP